MGCYPQKISGLARNSGNAPNWSHKFFERVVRHQE